MTSAAGVGDGDGTSVWDMVIVDSRVEDVAKCTGYMFEVMEPLAPMFGNVLGPLAPILVVVFVTPAVTLQVCIQVPAARALSTTSFEHRLRVTSSRLPFCLI
jgi:hypothetical protein